VRKTDITVDVVRALIAAQFPAWRDRPVAPVELDGWDNTSFRLGDDLVVRLPSHEQYVVEIDKEHRWLPVLAEQLPLPIPVPVARGVPDATFPRPWSVYRWLPGRPATHDQLDDLVACARTLADFLTALMAVDATGGPAAGDHSFQRGGPVGAWDEQTRSSITTMADTIDADAAMAVWDAAVASTGTAPPVWVHGDVTPSNLLAVDGRLAAVLDFGCCAVGDPACDLAIAWTLFDGPSRRAFRDGLALDAATWARGRGWALWKAAIGHVGAARTGESPESVAARFGWRWTPHGVIAEVLADHGAES
jgi:aminoglycoside phosphotransferase (APT) family kinase protein